MWDLRHLASVTTAPRGEFSCCSRGTQIWDEDGPSPAAQLGLEKALGTIAGKWDLTVGFLMPSLPSTQPCLGAPQNRNTELGASDKKEKCWGPRGSRCKPEPQCVLSCWLPFKPLLLQSQFSLPKCRNSVCPGHPKTQPF